MKTHHTVTLRDPKKLQPYAHNAKRHTVAEVEKLVRQIRAFGFDQPIVVDAKGVIIKGHKRRLAALTLGCKRVPVVVNDLSETQARAARLGDNYAVTLEVDPEALRFDLRSLQADGADMALTGMDVGKIDLLMAEPVAEPEPEPPAAQPADPKDDGLTLRFADEQVAMSLAELADLLGRLQSFEKQHGSRRGFVGQLCRGG